MSHAGVAVLIRNPPLQLGYEAVLNLDNVVTSLADQVVVMVG